CGSRPAVSWCRSPRRGSARFWRCCCCTPIAASQRRGGWGRGGGGGGPAAPGGRGAPPSRGRARAARAVSPGARGRRAAAGPRAGYVLRVAEGELDAHVFEQLAMAGLDARAAGNAAAASGYLRRALGLWSGEPMADLDLAGAAAAECGRLAELRRQAAGARI